MSSPTTFRCGRYYDCDRQLEYPLGTLQHYCPGESDLLRIRASVQAHESAAQALQTAAISDVRVAIRAAANRLRAALPVSVAELESKFDTLLLKQVTDAPPAFAASRSFERAVRGEAEADWEALALENNRAQQVRKQQEHAEAQQLEALRKLAEVEKQKRDMHIQNQRDAESRAERATQEARKLQEAMQRSANEPGFFSGMFFCFVMIMLAPLGL